MHVYELADELHISIEAVLKKLKSLKLKAKDGDQVLNKAVIIVLRSELKKDMQDPQKMQLMQKQRAREKEKKSLVRKSPETAVPAEEPASDTESKAAKKGTTVKKKTVRGRKPAAKTKAEGNKAKVASPDKKAQAKPEPEPEEKPKKIKTKKIEAPFVPLKPLAKKKRKTAGGKTARDSSDSKSSSGRRRSSSDASFAPGEGTDNDSRR